MTVREKPGGLSRVLRSRTVEALLGLLFLAAILAPRVGIEVHSHGGGGHAHVHFAPGAQSDLQGAHRHDARALPQRTADGGPGLRGSHDPEHLHAFDPFLHAVASEPLSLAIVLLLLSLAAPPALRATQRSLVTAQARAPPPLSRIRSS